MMNITVFTDGGARGNPGPAGAGVFIATGDKEYRYGLYLGEKTNNQAEYLALCQAFEVLNEEVEASHVDEIEVFMDSELIVKQLSGEYKVKDASLKLLYDRVRDLVKKYPMVQFTHVPRSKNKVADGLVNQVLDIQNGITTDT